MCSLDNTLSSIATFVSFTARVTPPAKPCLPAPRACPRQDIDRRLRARQLRPGQQGLDARLHTNVVPFRNLTWVTQRVRASIKIS